MTILTAVLIVIAMAIGRRIQGGGMNSWHRWPWRPSEGEHRQWPLPDFTVRLIYAAIAYVCAWVWSGSFAVGAAVLWTWFGACCIGLFSSIGQFDPMWRGCARGFVQCACPVAALIAADVYGLLTAGYFVLMWPVIGAAMGPIYRLAWKQERWQPTVMAEYATGAAWGIGLIVALI